MVSKYWSTDYLENNRSVRQSKFSSHKEQYELFYVFCQIIDTTGDLMHVSVMQWNINPFMPNVP